MKGCVVIGLLVCWGIGLVGYLVIGVFVGLLDDSFIWLLMSRLFGCLIIGLCGYWYWIVGLCGYLVIGRVRSPKIHWGPRGQINWGPFGPLKKVASLRDPCPESPKMVGYTVKQVASNTYSGIVDQAVSTSNFELVLDQARALAVVVARAHRLRDC